MIKNSTSTIKLANDYNYALHVHKFSSYLPLILWSLLAEQPFRQNKQNSITLFIFGYSFMYPVWIYAAHLHERKSQASSMTLTARNCKQ